jgi:hypothetical protein
MWIYIDVKQPDGTVTNWAIEAGGSTQLLRRGLRKTDFPPGIDVTVEGFRARSGDPKANGRSGSLCLCGKSSAVSRSEKRV